MINLMRRIYFVSILLSLLVLAACQQEDYTSDKVGYLNVNVSPVFGVVTKGLVPDNYKLKQLCVEIKNEAGIVVESTEDYAEWEGKQLKLKSGTYMITASSNGFDGNASGVDIPYYKGSTQVTVVAGKEVTASIICTLANVKVTVNFEDSFTNSFKSAVVLIESKVPGISGQNLMMGAQNKSIYFPEGDLKATITVINKANQTHTLSQDITKVKARDHYVLNYRVSDSGSVGDITVDVDDSEKKYTYEITVPVTSSTQLEVASANAWSNFALLEGKISSIKEGVELDPTCMKFEYKTERAAEWSECSATKEGDLFKATLKGLTPATSYSYRLSYDKAGDNYASDVKTFTTETVTALPNGNLDSWYKSGKTWYAASKEYFDANGSFWDSSNPGTTTGVGGLVNINPTMGNASIVHTQGGQSAELKTQTAMGVLAAASLYTGKYGATKSDFSGATLEFGRPFTSRPTAFHGWFRYSTKAIDVVGSNLPSSANVIKGQTQDLCSIYIVLATKSYQIDNTNPSTFINFENDDAIVAHGELPMADCVATNGSWREFNIDLKYHKLDVKPTHIIIVCSASKYGDYFTGSTSSVLYLDDFELIYGDEPKTK